MDRKNHPDSLPFGSPPLGGGWVGFSDEDVCPTLWRCFDTRLVVVGNEESLFLLASINHFS
ncbi:hypothetical protein HMPREF0973_00212 [Prevotella veroralis F0319]|uniref:Uncharacterized protein n=1 Tax=Prevotella veroralis F0319 TaxID=649761 RepID=C9MKT8_9BACT|nr:hypothetical protein HMPREF0973_00212 [Prevotella veroralis F0319]